jgi:hypothetical protein
MGEEEEDVEDGAARDHGVTSDDATNSYYGVSDVY